MALIEVVLGNKGKKKVKERTVQTTFPSSSCEGVAAVIWILRGVDTRVFLAVYAGICSCIFLRGR